MEIWNILKLLKLSKTLETSWPYLGNYRSKTLETSWTHCTDESGLVDCFLWHWENWDLPCRAEEHTRCIIDPPNYVQMGFQTWWGRNSTCHNVSYNLSSISILNWKGDRPHQGDPRRITRNGANPTSVISAGALGWTLGQSQILGQNHFLFLRPIVSDKIT